MRHSIVKYENLSTEREQEKYTVLVDTDCKAKQSWINPVLIWDYMYQQKVIII